MYTFEDLRLRCQTIYKGQVERHKKKLEKSAGRGVKLEIKSKDVLPYSFDEFLNWAWNKYGVKVFLCRWCTRPIDFIEAQLDHPIPIRRGGHWTLANLEAICKECNELKGEQTPEEYTLLLQFLGSLSTTHRAYIEQRIRAGAAGNRMRFFPHVKKEKAQPGTGPTDPTPPPSSKPRAIQQRINLGGTQKPLF